MMKHPPPPLASQHLGANQSLHLHLNAGDALQIVSGQARIERQLWIAERMMTQHTALAAEQTHICPNAGWIRLIGLSAVDFVVKESWHEDQAGWRGILSRLIPLGLRRLTTSAQ